MRQNQGACIRRTRFRVIKSRSYRTVFVAFVLLAVPGVQAVGASTPRWPSTLDGHLWSGQATKKGPLAMNTLVSPYVLGAEGGAQLPAYEGNTGWATATLDRFLYPIVSHDHGKTWHVGGVYFAVPVASSVYYVSSVKIFTPRIVAIYALRSETFDFTSDGGRHWYQTFFPGLIQSITNLGLKSAILPEGTIQVEIQSGPDSLARTGFYRSRNGGLSWVRHLPHS